MTSAIPVQRSTTWANKPTGSRSMCWVQINHSSDEWWLQIYEIHTFALRWRYEITRSSQLRTLLKRLVESRTWKKIQARTVFEPMTPAIPVIVDILISYIYNHHLSVYLAPATWYHRVVDLRFVPASMKNTLKNNICFRWTLFLRNQKRLYYKYIYIS